MLGTISWAQLWARGGRLGVDPNIIINVGILVVSAGAAAIAWWQAISADRAKTDAAREAGRSVEAAEASASSAQRSASAAERHVEIVTEAEERQRANEERRQAEMISAWVEHKDADNSVVIVSNASDTAIYEVFAAEGIANREGHYAFSTFEGSRTGVHKIAPGRWEMPLPPKFGHSSGMGAFVDIALAFRDARDVHWMRDASGRLRRLNQEGWRELEVEMPFSWSRPTPAQ